jgi:hypothetical protein
MQYAQGTTNKNAAQCFHGKDYAKYGKASNCTAKDNAGNIFGGNWTNAVYKL